VWLPPNTIWTAKRIVNLDDINKITETLFFLITASAAIYGLRTWRKELTGRASFDAAKNVVAGAYQVRDEIRNCQASFMTPDEWADRKPTADESPQQQQSAQIFYALGRRYNRVHDVIVQWNPHVIEAEALFGKEARDLLDRLKLCARKLSAAIEIYYRAEYHGHYSHAKHEKFFNIIYGINDQEFPDLKGDDQPVIDDGFQENLVAALEDIDSYFVRHMRPDRIVWPWVRNHWVLVAIVALVGVSAGVMLSIIGIALILGLVV
jgi:hypothetical protein